MGGSWRPDNFRTVKSGEVRESSVFLSTAARAVLEVWRESPAPPMYTWMAHAPPRPRPFALFVAGSTMSMFGSRISLVAFPMLVLSLDGSPLVAGLVSCATILPSLLAYIPAG